MNALGDIWLHICQSDVVVTKGVSGATCLGPWWVQWQIYCQTGKAGASHLHRPFWDLARGPWVYMISCSSKTCKSVRSFIFLPFNVLSIKPFLVQDGPGVTVGALRIQLRRLWAGDTFSLELIGYIYEVWNHCCLWLLLLAIQEYSYHLLTHLVTRKSRVREYMKLWICPAEPAPEVNR